MLKSRRPSKDNTMSLWIKRASGYSHGDSYEQAYKVVRVLILKTNLHDNYHPSRLEAV